MKLLYLLRAGLLYALLAIGVMFWAWAVILAWPFPIKVRFYVANGFFYYSIFLLRLLVGVRHRVHGLENIPDRPFILMPRHSSVWETLVFQSMFPPYCWVLKRELMWIPILGWGIKALGAIAINRSAHRRAIRQMLAQSRIRIAQGVSVLVFPEGTRVAAGEQRRFGLGGAILACDNQVPVLPVAHNAGVYWGRRKIVRGPALIEVEIGPPIEPRDRKPEAVTADAKAWIDERVAVLEGRAFEALKK